MLCSKTLCTCMLTKGGRSTNGFLTNVTKMRFADPIFFVICRFITSTSLQINTFSPYKCNIIHYYNLYIRNSLFSFWINHKNYQICNLQNGAPKKFAMSEWAQEFGDLRFADFYNMFFCPPLMITHPPTPFAPIWHRKIFWKRSFNCVRTHERIIFLVISHSCCFLGLVYSMPKPISLKSLVYKNGIWREDLIAFHLLAVPGLGAG
jgi:hypothetical protein